MHCSFSKQSSDVFVAGDRIDKITSGGAVSRFATLPAGSFPAGLAFDANGNLYAANSNTDQISKITSTGVVSLFAMLPGASPTGLAFDGGGYLYCTLPQPFGNSSSRRNDASTIR